MSRMRVSRESQPRQCGGPCGKTRLVLHYVIDGKAFRLCSDCWSQLGFARTRVMTEQLDAIEVP